MNQVIIAAGAAAAVYYFSKRKRGDTLAESEYDAKDAKRSVPTSSEIGAANQVWSQNPIVMFKGFFTPSPVQDPTRNPPVSSSVQLAANAISDPFVTNRPRGLGASTDTTGAEQDDATSSSMEQENNPVSSAVYKSEMQTLDEMDVTRQIHSPLDTHEQSVSEANRTHYESWGAGASF